VNRAVRTSTLGLIPGRKQSVSYPTAEQAHTRAVENMAGHDALPKTLRLFLHEYGCWFPQKSIVQIVDTLKGGHGIRITCPDGKIHEIVPDPPKR
jgi:hypothetical protein